MVFVHVYIHASRVRIAVSFDRTSGTYRHVTHLPRLKDEKVSIALDQCDAIVKSWTVFGCAKLETHCIGSHSLVLNDFDMIQWYLLWVFAVSVCCECLLWMFAVSVYGGCLL